MENLLGIYEKALPDCFAWKERLECAKELGFDFVEISIDETDERLSRLYWNAARRAEMRQHIWQTGIPVLSMCFSGHRRIPLGSRDPEVRAKALELMERAIDFAADVGIRVVQLAGYDVYYEESGQDTEEFFLENLKKSVKMAERRQVMLAIEIMDTTYINSITKYLWWDKMIQSPWLTVYPDLGNLTAWGNDVTEELKKGIHRVVGIHVKETLAVTGDFPGKFKEVSFGTGCVNFVDAFKTLRELSYTGPFLIEMWSGKCDDSVEKVKTAKAFVLEKMAAAGYR